MNTSAFVNGRVSVFTVSHWLNRSFILRHRDNLVISKKCDGDRLYDKEGAFALLKNEIVQSDSRSVDPVSLKGQRLGLGSAKMPYQGREMDRWDSAKPNEPGFAAVRTQKGCPEGLSGCSLVPARWTNRFRECCGDTEMMVGCKSHPVWLGKCFILPAFCA